LDKFYILWYIALVDRLKENKLWTQKR